jgi:hypothetical protein
MPLFYVICPEGHEDKRVLEPEQVKGLKCRTCNKKVKRQPKPPTSMLKNRIDNGLVMKTLENYDDCAQMNHERSHLDLSRPDYLVQNEDK